jgi:hypothetical protein
MIWHRTAALTSLSLNPNRKVAEISFGTVRTVETGHTGCGKQFAKVAPTRSVMPAQVSLHIRLVPWLRANGVAM